MFASCHAAREPRLFGAGGPPRARHAGGPAGRVDLPRRELCRPRGGTVNTNTNILRRPRPASRSINHKPPPAPHGHGAGGQAPQPVAVSAAGAPGGGPVPQSPTAARGRGRIVDDRVVPVHESRPHPSRACVVAASKYSILLRHTVRSRPNPAHVKGRYKRWRPGCDSVVGHSQQCCCCHHHHPNGSRFGNGRDDWVIKEDKTRSAAIEPFPRVSGRSTLPHPTSARFCFFLSSPAWDAILGSGRCFLIYISPSSALTVYINL